MRSRGAGLAAALLALPSVPFALGLDPGEGIVGAVLVGTVVLGAPGVVGAMAVRGGGAARRAVGGLAAAFVLVVVAIVALRLAGAAPGPRSLAGALGGATALAGAVVRLRGGTLPDPRGHVAPLALAGLAFVLAFLAGTRVVPPLEDQDTEVQGTAWGLVHDLQPLCLTNRSTLYFFAHPPLLHWLNAATLTLSGDLDTVRPAYDAAVAARAAQPERLRARGVGAALEALRDPAPRPDRYAAWRRGVYRPFLERPALFGTRVPNFALAACAAALLWALARRLGARPADAALAVVAHVTLPEIFVRSGYGGYFALTSVTFLAGATLAAGTRGGGRAGFAAGVLAILANQKALVPGVAAAGARGLEALRARTGGTGPAGGPLRAAGPWLAGLAAGGAAFWIWGLALAPHEFVADHLLDHGVRRFAGGEVVGRGGQLAYPTRAGLWAEFGGHMGWIWTGLAAAALVAVVVRLVRRAGDRARPASAVASLRLHLVLWVLVGAVVFTATDWRQTKHLCLLVPALSALLAAEATAGPRPARLAARALLAAAVAHNAVRLVALARDFGSLPVSTVW